MTSFKRLFFVWTAFLILTSACLPQAQGDTKLTIYVLSESNELHTLNQVNLATGEQRVIFSTPKTTSEDFSSLVTADDRAAVERWVTPARVPGVLNSPLDIVIQSFVVSPDNQRVAIHLKYQKCIPPRYDCYGISKILVVSTATGEQREVFSLGFNESRYFPESTPRLIREATIFDIKWMFDQQALIVSINHDGIRRNLGNDPLIVIPMYNNIQPFRIGEAQIWTVSPRGQTVAGISRNSEIQDSVFMVDFDPTTGTFSRQDYSLGSYVVCNGCGMAYIEHSLAFVIDYDSSLPQGGGGLAIFDPTQAKSLVVFPSPSRYRDPLHIGSTPDGNLTLIETRSGSLWQVTLQDNIPQTTSFLQIPIESWSINNNGDILIQLPDSPEYQIRDQQGALISRVNISRFGQ
ncbi:MAG: hypothetical protein K8I60_12465 [Anaerolineae bacterium]|nr:hypothetical protein [Anaerolineae bacterium]